MMLINKLTQIVQEDLGGTTSLGQKVITYWLEPEIHLQKTSLPSNAFQAQEPTIRWSSSKLFGDLQRVRLRPSRLQTIAPRSSLPISGLTSSSRSTFLWLGGSGWSPAAAARCCTSVPRWNSRPESWWSAWLRPSLQRCSRTDGSEAFWSS